MKVHLVKHDQITYVANSHVFTKGLFLRFILLSVSPCPTSSNKLDSVAPSSKGPQQMRMISVSTSICCALYFAWRMARTAGSPPGSCKSDKGCNSRSSLLTEGAPGESRSSLFVTLAWWLLLPWQQEGLLWPPPGVAALTTSQVQCIEKAGKTPGFAHHLCLATALSRWRTSQARAKPRMETQDLEQQQGAQGALSLRILKKICTKTVPQMCASSTARLQSLASMHAFRNCPAVSCELVLALWDALVPSILYWCNAHAHSVYSASFQEVSIQSFYAVLIRMCQVSCLDFVPMILAPVLELDSSSCCFQVLRAFWAAWCCKM